ncbi:hypothetical protein E2C01_006624 [Portunus trituberculatus]|uniref:Uncharacterized protein n=1 Tax=Portunus trituberculatus TaxID=210409 RepID=A0A5B7CYN0_PORTR|nr:hypothetical protein [Portunus trituberculatus]
MKHSLQRFMVRQDNKTISAQHSTLVHQPSASSSQGNTHTSKASQGQQPQSSQSQGHCVKVSMALSARSLYSCPMNADGKQISVI